MRLRLNILPPASLVIQKIINGTDACAILSQSVNEAGYGLFIVIENKTKIYRELTTTGSVYQPDGVICGVRLPNNERRFLQQSAAIRIPIAGSQCTENRRDCQQKVYGDANIGRRVSRANVHRRFRSSKRQPAWSITGSARQVQIDTSINRLRRR